MSIYIFVGMKKRVRVFLGGYINYMNAQNINCKSIAMHLDEEIYEVKTLMFSESGYVNIPSHVKIIRVLNNRFSIFLAFLRAFFWADVAYVPKHQSTPRMILRIGNLLGVKIFTTIEANMCDTRKRSMIDSFGTVENMRNYFKLIPNIYGITQHIINRSTCGIKLKKDVLCLGVESSDFYPLVRKKINNIVFIGNLGSNKRVDEFFRLAKMFPDLSFHVIGNRRFVNIRKKKQRLTLENTTRASFLPKDIPKNVTLHGRVDRQELADIIQGMDVHFLPSRSEGFPKVILETAASGVPSIVYNTYGAEEWIENEKNGFLVNDFEEVVSIVESLLDNPMLLSRVSKGAINLSDRYDWKYIIKRWQNTIDNIL